jgi:hypothetical protein
MVASFRMLWRRDAPDCGASEGEATMKAMLWVAPVMLIVAIAAAACATQKFVKTEIRRVEAKRGT